MLKFSKHNCKTDFLKTYFYIMVISISQSEIDEAMGIFKQFDIDGNGVIDRFELKKMLTGKI